MNPKNHSGATDPQEGVQPVRAFTEAGRQGWTGMRAAASNYRVALVALALFLIWTGATYLLEGRILTLQRPDATGARLLYALIANIIIGIGATALVVRALAKAGSISPAQAGFRGPARAVIAVPIGAVLGLALYALQGAPSLDPVVILNAYAQVLVVSVAEVLVCWAVVGSVSESLFSGAGRRVAPILSAVVASVLFGVYHFAHSPPFNTLGFVALLTAIGFLTSAFFFVSRDIYGTIAFHNFLGIFGVVRALEQSGELASFETPVIPLIATAVVTVALLVAAHAYLISGASQKPARAG